MTTYYVSTSGSNGNTGTGTGDAWRNIEYAVTNAVVGAGDVIKVMPGTYAENVFWTDSNGGREGTPGQPIVLESYDENNWPIISGPERWPAYSSPFQFEIKNLSHIIVNGFSFRNFWNCGGLRVRADNRSISDVTVQNCHFEQGGYTTYDPDNNPDRHILEGQTWNSQSTFYSITRCHFFNVTFKDVQTGAGNGFNEVCTLQGYLYDSSIQDCTIDHGSFIAFDVIGAWSSTGSHYGYPKRVILRGNVVKNMMADDRGGKNGLYLDRLKSHCLVEENRLSDVGKGIHVGCETGWNYNFGHGELVIVRNNVAHGANVMVDGVGGSGWKSNPTETITSYNYYDRVAVCNNVFYTTGGDVVPYRCTSSKNAKTKNNVIRSEGTSPYMVLNGQYTQNYMEGRDFKGNMFSGSGNRYFPVYNQDYRSYTQFAAAGWNTSGFVGTPVYTNRNSDYFYDWRLTSSSPGYGQGIGLTSTTSARTNSTQLAVDDACYFFDGWGIYGYTRDAGTTVLYAEGGDTIKINGKVAVIESIEYDTNVITIDRPLSWGAGEQVNYAYEGNAPSIGVTLPVATVSGSIPDTPPVDPVDPPDETTPDPVSILNDNHEFDDGMNDWQFYSTAGDYTATASGGEVDITGSTAGSYTQLMQSGLPLIAGETYTAIITVKSTQACVGSLDVLLNVSPYSVYATQPVAIGTDYNTFSYVFVAPSTTSDARLRLTVLNSPDGESMTITVDRLVLVFGDNETGVTAPVAVSGYPANVYASVGDDAMFAASFTGTTPTYKWCNAGDNTDVVDDDRISGATSKTLSIASVTVEDSGTEYFCKALNSAGEASSEISSLFVGESPAPGTPDGIVALQVADGNWDVSVTPLNSNFYLAEATNFFGDITNANYDIQVASIVELTDEIREGSKITACTVEAYINGSVAGVLPLNVAFEDYADAVPWVDSADCLNRALTGVVDWSPDVPAAYGWRTSPDLIHIMQQLIWNHGGLKAGARIGIRFLPSPEGWSGSALFGRVSAYDNDPSTAVKLNIEWEAPSNAAEGRPLRMGTAWGIRVGL